MSVEQARGEGSGVDAKGHSPMFSSQRRARLWGSMSRGHFPGTTVVVMMALSIEALSRGRPMRCHSRSKTGFPRA